MVEWLRAPSHVREELGRVGSSPSDDACRQKGDPILNFRRQPEASNLLIEGEKIDEKQKERKIMKNKFP